MAVLLPCLRKDTFRSSQLNLFCKYQHFCSHHEPFVARRSSVTRPEMMCSMEPFLQDRHMLPQPARNGETAT